MRGMRILQSSRSFDFESQLSSDLQCQAISSALPVDWLQPDAAALVLAVYGANATGRIFSLHPGRR
jgi:hypothetical protein